MQTTSLFDTESTEAVEGAHLAQLGGGDHLNVQHFELEPGAVVPEHAHDDHEQLSFLYEGVLRFVVGGEEVSANAGDAALFAPGEAHAVENRGDAVARGVDVYSPPRPEPDWINE